MPLILDQHTDDGAHILIYHGLEDLAYFLPKTHLTNSERALIEKYSIERRKKDLVIARYLLQQSIPQAEVIYHSNGKPYLKNDEAKISISHSNELVAVILHPQKVVAIDVEYITTRVERIKQRFLSSKELKLANTTQLLTLYWSAKETLFKLDEQQGLEFNTQLSLKPNDNNTLIGKIRNKEDIKVHFSINQDWVMTCAVL